MAKVKKADRYKLAPVYIDGNIVYSLREAWAYYKITPSAFEFLSTRAQINLANETISALATLTNHTSKPVDGHILITNTPFDVDSWESQMREMYNSWNQSASKASRYTFNKFLNTQVEELKNENYQRRTIYLGIKISTRGAFSLDDFNLGSLDVRELIDVAKNAFMSSIALPTEEVKSEERTRTRSREKDIQRELRNSSLHAAPVSAEEILLVNKRLLHPGMPAPYLVTNHEERIGLNDMVMETGGIIKDKHRYLEFSQEIDGYEYTGYRSTLTFTRFPKTGMGIPGISPFMYVPALMGLPFTLSSRFTLKPSATMKKELDKKRADLDDELKNLEGSNQRPGQHIYDKSSDIDTLDRDLHEENLPWMSGVYRLIIESSSEDFLREATVAMRNEYAKNDIVLTLTSGDQLQLLHEDILGGTQSSGEFSQLTNLAMLGTSGFNFGSQVGDPVSDKNNHNRGE